MNALTQTPLPHGLRTYIQINLKKDVIRASLRCYSSIVHQEKEYVRFTDSTIIVMQRKQLKLLRLNNNNN